MPAARRGPLLTLFWRSHRALYRLSGGRLLPRVGPLPVLMLTTRGRRSGAARAVALSYLDHHGVPVVVGSNAGADAHPGWWLNLRSDPAAEVAIGGRRYRARARALGGEEREAVWRALIARDPSYAEYARRTARELPLVALDETAP